MKVSSSDKVGAKINDELDTEWWLLPFLFYGDVAEFGWMQGPAKPQTYVHVGSNPTITS